MIRRPCTRAFLMVQGMKAFLFTCLPRPHDLSHPSMSAPEMWTRDMMATRTPFRGKQVVKDWVDTSGLDRSLLREGSLGTRDPCQHAGPQVGQVRRRSSSGRGETHSQSVRYTCSGYTKTRVCQRLGQVLTDQTGRPGTDMSTEANRPFAPGQTLFITIFLFTEAHKRSETRILNLHTCKMRVAIFTIIKT